jgi:hypothetical protein
MADKGAENSENKNGKAPDDGKPKVYELDFADLTRAKKRPDSRAVIHVEAFEINLDGEEFGFGASDLVGLTYRPLEGDELSEILESVQDYDDAEVRQRKFDDAIIRRCLLKPAIPETYEGEQIVEGWLPGTRRTIAQAIRNRSGMGLHTIKSAKEALGNLVALTTPTSSISG